MTTPQPTVERSLVAEGFNFPCKKCESKDVWYTTGETFDGAYDKYYYHCHACSHRWTVVSECD